MAKENILLELGIEKHKPVIHYVVQNFRIVFSCNLSFIPNSIYPFEIKRKFINEEFIKEEGNVITRSYKERKKLLMNELQRHF